ncbi:MAG: ABC transporter ATP-binding protein [Thermoplasmatota archaeon]
MPALRCRALAKRYTRASRPWILAPFGGGRTESSVVDAVRGIDLSVEPGEVFGLLGPNGAGKTTTMRMIVGLTPPSEGTLEVLGHEIPRDLRAAKARMGVVPQEPNLDNDMEVRDQLIAWARFYDITGSAARTRVDEVLRLFALEEKAEARVVELSGGMKRRMLLARALVHDPEFLILDEPTVGLDPQSRHLLWDRIRSLAAEGKTILLSTHYMHEAEALCDRLAIMHEGRILELGRPAELIARHLRKDVLEIEVRPGARDPLMAAAKAYLGDKLDADNFGDRIFFRVDDAEAFLAQLRQARAEFTSALARRATLEDLFLKLTGRGLSEG